MKKFLFSLTALATFAGAAAPASAADGKFGSECGLYDDYGNEKIVEVRSLNVSDMEDDEIRALPTLTKQQLIIAAKRFSEGSEDIVIENTLDAVLALRYASDGNSVSVNTLRSRGKLFTEVLHYPGDNPYGYIFKAGTTKLVALIQDSDIVCN